MPSARPKCIPGELYHVYARSAAQRPIMPTGGHREELLLRMQRSFDKYDVACHAYSILTTHYHLLVTPRQDNLKRAMQWLNARYAEWFNETHEVTGHVFGSPYKAVHVRSDAHLLHLVWYLAHNPVAAGLCRRVDEWPWSSYLALIGELPPEFLCVDELLRLFDFDPVEARRRIENYVGSFEAEP
jgi:REP element-mobilizing transposase RayT